MSDGRIERHRGRPVAEGRRGHPLRREHLIGPQHHPRGSCTGVDRVEAVVEVDRHPTATSDPPQSTHGSVAVSGHGDAFDFTIHDGRGRSQAWSPTSSPRSARRCAPTSKAHQRSRPRMRGVPATDRRAWVGSLAGSDGVRWRAGLWAALDQAGRRARSCRIPVIGIVRQANGCGWRLRPPATAHSSAWVPPGRRPTRGW